MADDGGRIDLLEWFAVLGEGVCLAMAAGYAALEYRWTQRAAEMESVTPGIVIHENWNTWDDIRSALWWGLTLVSLVPWVYVATGRPLPPPLLSALTAAASTVFLLLVLAETVPSGHLSDDGDPRGEGYDSRVRSPPRLNR